MSAAIKEPAADTVTLLLALEKEDLRKLPPAVREVLAAAARDLEQWESTAGFCIAKLTEVMTLRCGQMDSQSRLDEMQQKIRSTMAVVIAALEHQSNS